ncbi:olfactory receptor 5AR1-like [Gastrophryne carolinensis]
MEPSNQTSNRFVLLGLDYSPSLMITAFLAFTAIYCITLSGNLLLIIVVRLTPKLQTPMYFFLSNLSVIDMGFCSTVIPRLLFNTISKTKSMSMVECAIQMQVHLTLGTVECFLLAIMAYDRYVAICKPLHYITIMSPKKCIGLVALSWFASLVNSIIHVIYTFQLSFCRSHHVNHYFCEVPPFLQMSCNEDTWLHELAMYISAAIVTPMCFILTLISYIRIVSTILKIRSSQGRYKAFSTCGSHLTVVSFYYGAIMVMYFRPHSANSSKKDKSISLLYTAVCPMINPIIYSIRNKDVQGAVRKLLYIKGSI